MDPLAPNPQQPSNIPENITPPQPQQQPVSQPVVQATPEPIQPQMQPQNFQPTQSAPITPQPQVKPKRPVIKIVSVILLILAVLGGGSAAAYFGLIVPNKPENVLQSAFKNTLAQKTVTSKMVLEGKDGDSPAYKAIVNLKSDTVKKSAEMGLEVTIAGVKVNGEVRYVGSSAYIKVGDLSSVISLLNASQSPYGSLLSQLNSKVTNQWFEIDSTLLKEANIDCALKDNLSITDQDYNVLAEGYKKHPFITIKNSSKDTLNGKAATKFQITFDAKKADQFGETFPKTPLYKKLDACFKITDTSKSGNGIDKEISSTINGAVEPAENLTYTVWVDKASKTIQRLVVDSTAKDSKGKNSTGSLDVTLDYGAVSIDKPANSKSINTLLTELSQMYQDQPVLGDSIERYIP